MEEQEGSVVLKNGSSVLWGVIVNIHQEPEREAEKVL